MSTITESAPVPATSACEVPPEQFWRISVENYHEMLRAEIIQDDDPVELLEGWLVQKMPKKPPYVIASELLRDAIEAVLSSGWHINSQQPITLVDSEPEPDLCVVRGTRRDYLESNPSPGDLALVVEVADASLLRDQTLKKRIYARAGIVEYWIVNVRDRQIEVHTSPTGPAETPEYLQQQHFTHDQSVTLRLDGQNIGEIAVSDLLP